jgi:uncharacterized repeat protein (TIGR01451 family)
MKKWISILYILLTALAVFGQGVGDNPLMDIRVVVLENTCEGGGHFADLAFQVATSDGSNRAIKQIQDAVILPTDFANVVTSIEARQWRFPDASYQNEYKWTPSERVLEFRSTHLDGQAWTKAGGPDSDTWTTVAVFRVHYNYTLGAFGSVAWYDGTPHYNVLALKSPAPGTETIHRNEVEMPDEFALDVGTDLAVTIETSKTDPEQEEIFTLTMHVEHVSGMAATDIQITDNAVFTGSGAFLNFISASGDGSYNADTHIWSIPSLAIGASADMALQVRAKMTGNWEVTAALNSVEPCDIDAGNDQDTVGFGVSACADLGIAVAFDRASATQGEFVYKTLTVTHLGGSPATNVVVRDTLDIIRPPATEAAFEFVSQQGTGIYNPLRKTWTIGTMTAGQVVTIQFCLKVLTSGPLTNWATVYFDTPAACVGDGTNDHRAGDTVDADAGADLEIDVSAAELQVQAGNDMTLTVTVHNNGEADATDISVANLIPPSFEYVSHTQDDGDYDSGTGVWSIPELAEGNDVSLNIVVRPYAAGLFTVRGEITASQPLDYLTTNNVDEENIEVEGAVDLAVAIEADPTECMVSQTINITLSVENLLGSDAQDVDINYILPEDYYQLTETAGDGSYDVGTGIWTVGEVLRGESKSIVLTLRALTPQLAITHTVTLNSSSPTDLNVSNNEATVNTDINEGEVDLEVNIAANPTSTYISESITITLTVQNVSPVEMDATSVSIEYHYPNSYYSYHGSSGDGSYDGNTGMWDVGDVPWNETRTINLTLTARAHSTTDIEHQAALANLDQTDMEPGNNEASTNTTVLPGSDLRVGINADPILCSIGSIVEMGFSLDNDGPDSTKALLNYQIPAGFTLIAVHGIPGYDADGTYDPVTGDWDPFAPDIAGFWPGEYKLMWMTLRADALGEFTHTITLMNSTQPDLNEDNNTAEVIVNVTPLADLVISGEFDPLTQWQGNQAVLHLSAENLGPSQATSVTAQITLPEGMTYVSHDGLLNFNSGTGVWDIQSLDEGADPVTLDITVRVDTCVSPLTVPVSIASPEVADPDEGNNSAEISLDVSCSTRLFARVYLEGPYRLHVTDITCPSCPDTAWMSTKLRHHPRAGYHCQIPEISPYADARDSGVADPDDLPENIVDWVYVQFRPSSSPYDPEVMLNNGFTGISCFLRKDGALLDINGREGVLVPELPQDSYYIIISHRNHLKVMSSEPVDLSSLTEYNFGQLPKHYYDFTEAKTQFYTKDDDDQRGCHLQAINGKWLVAAGDGDNGQQDENQDWDLWFGANGLSIGYFTEDYDLGGQVEGRDETLWYDNLFLRSPFSWDMTQP